MFKTIAVTNRHLCSGSLIEQIERIARIKKPDSLILREKDLSNEEYESLALEVMRLCHEEQIECFLHSHVQIARKLNCKNIHLPFSSFQVNDNHLQSFEQVGVSIHSVEEAVWAEQKGATYLTAGHIFVTDCKMGLPPRGLEFLKEICKAVSIPVYGIGGIQEELVPLVREAGASGACIMSGFMKQYETIQN